MNPLIYFTLFHIQNWNKWEPVVLYFSVGTVNKCLFIIVKRGILDNLFTTVHIDYICSIQYIAQIDNPFIHFVIQYIFCICTMDNSLWYCPAKSLVLAQPPGHMMRRHSACGGGFTLSHKALQAFTVSVYFFCTLYKYVIQCYTAIVYWWKPFV